MRMQAYRSDMLRRRAALAARLLIAIGLASAFPSESAAQPPARAIPPGDSSRTSVLGTVQGAFMALSVADLAASRRWYVERLGLRPTLEIPPANGGAVAVLEGG